MLNFILFITVLGVWVGAVYLYFVLTRLIEDVREINKDIVECRAMMQRKLEQENERTQITNDEFLGI